VPLRRVNPAYVIATSTKVDVAGLKLSDKLTDSYFAKPAAKKEKKQGEEAFFAKAPKVRVSSLLQPPKSTHLPPR
jgi:large subunit ribosomal protein L6e